LQKEFSGSYLLRYLTALTTSFYWHCDNNSMSR